MRLRIFVIEEEGRSRDALCSYLQAQGHEVVCMSEPLDCSVYAGEQCDHEHACGDILFVDRFLPRMTGFDFIEKMTRKGCKGLLQNKVLMTGYLEDEDVERARALDHEIVIKPVRLTEIDRLLEKLSRNVDPDRKLANLDSPA